MGKVVVCQDCDGAGWTQVEVLKVTCERCLGSGRLVRVENITFEPYQPETPDMDTENEGETLAPEGT